MATPVFDGAREADVIELLNKAGLSETGQEWLVDGRTGEVFDRPVTVGYIYMLKLHHLVDEKFTLVRLVHIRWLHNSLLAVKLNLVASALVRWKCGHWKHMVRLIHCRKC